jgi:Lipid A 3-O-deacylase (PagL)
MMIVALGALVLAPSLLAQDAPEKGGHEVQFWTGGGASQPGGVRDISVWNAGFRYGWILTEALGPKGLRGRFEYGLDAIPVFWFFQPGGTAYGAGLSPVVLKWDFDSGSRVVPYVEANAAFVLATRATPPGAGHANFASSAAIGAHLLSKRGANISAEIRLMHVSDAGLTTYNPGINTLQVRIGLGRFFHSN